MHTCGHFVNAGLARNSSEAWGLVRSGVLPPHHWDSNVTRTQVSSQDPRRSARTARSSSEGASSPPDEPPQLIRRALFGEHLREHVRDMIVERVLRPVEASRPRLHRVHEQNMFFIGGSNRPAAAVEVTPGPGRIVRESKPEPGSRHRRSPIGLSRPYSRQLLFPGREHRAHMFDSTFPRLACFCGVDPVDEVPARVRRQAPPSGLRRRCHLESVVQIERHDCVTARPSLSGRQHVARRRRSA